MKSALACLVLSLWTTRLSGKDPLYIGAILPYTHDGWVGAFGRQSVLGTNLAVDEINQREDVLKDYTLHVIYKDSMFGNGILALNGLYDMFYSQPTKIAFIGELESHITEALAEVTGIWKTIQINQASSSPNLSDRDKFPYFFRALGAPNNLNEVQVKLLREFNWTKVAVLHEGEQPHSGVTYHLQQLLGVNDVSILATESFYNDPTEAMKVKDVRIIIGNFDQQMALAVFCNAFRLGMYGPKYIYFIVGYYTHRWWESSSAAQYGCDVTNMKEAVEGYFALTYSVHGRQEKQAINGMTPCEFREMVSSITHQRIDLNYADVTAQSHDIVWALALGLNASIDRLYPRNLSDFAYSDDHMAEVFRDEIGNVSFFGASGPVAFTENGDRIGRIVVEQDRDGDEVVIGSYYPAEEVEWLISKEEIWRRNGGVPPFDSDVTRTISLLQSTPVAIFIFACCLSTVGVALAGSFLAFNFKYRAKRIIKMSSPNLNNVIVAGFILAYICVVVIGLDLPLIRKSSLLTTCEIRVWMVNLAFTLAFGGMFTKMWRVYSIVVAGKTRRRVIRDRRLIGIVGLLFCVDLAVLIPRQVIDPFKLTEVRIPIPQTVEDMDNFVKYEYLYVRCTAKYEHIWVPALVAYKAVVMLFGAFLSLQTRKINVPSLNDASYVGLSIYNVCICSVVALPLSLFNTQEIGLTYAIVGSLMLFCTTVSLCMLFIPKIIALKSQNPEAALIVSRIGTVDPTTRNNNNLYVNPHQSTSQSNPVVSLRFHTGVQQTSPKHQTDQLRSTCEAAMPSPQ